MFLYGFCAAIYAVISTAAVVATFWEGQRKHLPWDAMRFAGIALSLLWPLGFALALFSLRKKKGKETARKQPRIVKRQ
jgi:hypothetical protein